VSHQVTDFQYKLLFSDELFQTWMPKAEPSSFPKWKDSYKKALPMSSCVLSFSQRGI